MMEAVLKLLAKRNWCFASASDDSQYITSDNPVVLSWIGDQQTIPYSPGHASEGTAILFPINPTLLLMGMFEELPEEATHTPFQVAAVNTCIARNSTKQIYARDGSFVVNLKDRNGVRGYDIARHFSR
jgi:hypothetical protein